jgi:phage gp45-like
VTFVSRRALLVCKGGKVGRGMIVVTYQPRLVTKPLSDGSSA